LLIRIDTSTGVPIWQQIVAQVTRQALSGRLVPGQRLPTVRELASELRVNPNTVARAYQELERTGVVETRRGLGTFAREVSDRQRLSDGRRALEHRIDALALEALHLGVAPDAFRALIDDRLRELEAKLPEAERFEEVKQG
jgi:GntR family transcriptional regulator